jgi:hypothetical protein
LAITSATARTQLFQNCAKPYPIVISRVTSSDSVARGAVELNAAETGASTAEFRTQPILIRFNAINSFIEKVRAGDQEIDSGEQADQ